MDGLVEHHTQRADIHAAAMFGIAGDKLHHFRAEKLVAKTFGLIVDQCAYGTERKSVGEPLGNRLERHAPFDVDILIEIFTIDLHSCVLLIIVVQYVIISDGFCYIL